MTDFMGMGMGMGRGRGMDRGSGVRAHGRTGVRESALPRGLQEDADVIGDALENRLHFHEGEITCVGDARLDARMNARIDARTPERPDARAPEPMLDWENDLQWQPERPTQNCMRRPTCRTREITLGTAG